MKWTIVVMLAFGCGKKASIKTGLGGGPKSTGAGSLVLEPHHLGPSQMTFQNDSYTFSVSQPPPAEIYLVNPGPGTFAFHHPGGNDGSGTFVWPVTLQGPDGVMYSFEYPGPRMHTMAIVPPKDYAIQPGEPVRYHLPMAFYKAELTADEWGQATQGNVEEFEFHPGEYWLHIDMKGSQHRTKLIVTP